MKSRCVILLSGLAIAGSLCAQPRQGNSAESKNFLLDASKPYVYLELDHVGPREPMQEGEPRVGLWLRLKNNCTVPIVVVMLKSSSVKAEPGVMDEIVPNPPAPKGDTAGSGIIYKPGQEGLAGLFLAPNSHGDEAWGEEGIHKGAPHGYNGDREPGVPMLTVVPSGGTFLFSLPISHVSKTWHFEVPFRFALEREGSTRQPYSYVALFWDDLPESYRKASEADQVPPR